VNRFAGYWGRAHTFTAKVSTVSLDASTNAFKGNATVLTNNINVDLLPCTRVNQDVKAVHYTNVLEIKVNLNYTGFL
jgi:hypothetical protein